jgi:hypothetical protein
VYIKREGRLMESEQVIKFRDRIADLEAENAMSDTEATDQLNEEIWNLAILGEPQAADALVRLVAGSRAIATACELENAALWAFVKEMRTLQVVLSDTKKPNETWKQWHTRKFHQAEELIYQYEDEP